MDYKFLIQEAADEILFWALEDDKSKLVHDATEIYLKGSESDKNMQGFNDWFVHDYRTESEESLVKLYMNEHKVDDEKRKALLAIEGSVFSAFERIGVEGKLVVKDLFTKSDYMLNEEMEAAGLMLMRIYTVDAAHFVLDKPEFLLEEYKSVLIKGMLEKYNEYCRLFMPVEMAQFTKKYSQVLYRFINVIDDTAAEYALDEEDFVVHQATYIVKDLKVVYEAFKESPGMELALDDPAGSVFKLLDSVTGDVLSEIVIADDRVEIECVNGALLDASKEAVVEIIGDLGTHLRDEIVSIDDLLNQ